MGRLAFVLPFYIFMFTTSTSNVTGKPLPIYTQDACIFHNDCAVYDTFGGVVLDASESSKITNALGDKKAVILSAHGLLTVGETIERCAFS